MIIYLKEATLEDVDLLFKWVNDESVRKSAFNSKLIAYSEHSEWFNQILQSSDCKIYIGYVDENPIGQIRIDLEDNIAVIDYSVDNRYRGRGYGAILLEALENEISYSLKQIKLIMGKVKYDNIYSRQTFEKAGYMNKKEMENMLYYKKIGGS